MNGDIYVSGHKTNRADLNHNAACLAAYLKASGLAENGVVAMLMRNDSLYLEVVEACRHIGATYVALNWHAAPLEIDHILKDAGAKILIGHADLMGVYVEGSEIAGDLTCIAAPTPAAIANAYGLTNAAASTIPNGCSPYADCLNVDAPLDGPQPRFRGMFAYTSGSTGQPKGIRRIVPADRPDPYVTYAGLAENLMHAGPGDRFYVAAPLYHSAPNGLTIFSLAAQHVDIYIEPKFDAEGFLRDVEQYKITHAYIVPTMAVRLLKLPQDVREKYDVSTLRFTLSTGSPFPVDVKAQMIDWFGPIFNESYGASEIGFMTLVSSAEAQQKPGTVGRILPGGSIKILDDNRNELPPGETGLIYVNLPTFGGFEYTNEPEGGGADRYEGHATVGDVGHVDEEGYLFISDRKKDMIISGGANIFPAEIEAALIDMPQVFDCAVFGAPDPEFGERIIAAVELQKGAELDLKTMQDFLSSRLARFKLPRKLDIHDALPREDSGKIFKQRLRAPYWEDAGRKV